MLSFPFSVGPILTGLFSFFKKNNNFNYRKDKECSRLIIVLFRGEVYTMRKSFAIDQQCSAVSKVNES